MIETHWYDALILYVKVDQQGWLEVKIGVVFILVVLWVIWKLLGVFLNRPKPDDPR